MKNLSVKALRRIPLIAFAVWLLTYSTLIGLNVIVAIPSQDVSSMPADVHERYVRQVAVSRVVEPIMNWSLLVIVIVGVVFYINASTKRHRDPHETK